MAQRKEFLTAAEVMERLRLGRTTVYQQARLFLATGGAEGIPCRRYGRSLRFPAAELEAMTGDPHAVTPAASKADDLAEARAHKPARAARRTDPLHATPDAPHAPTPKRRRAGHASARRLTTMPALDTRRTSQHDRQVPAGGRERERDREPARCCG